MSALRADEGSPDAHLVLVEPPVSTTTVTPDVPEQAAALAGAAATTSPASCETRCGDGAGDATEETSGRDGGIRREPHGAGRR